MKTSDFYSQNFEDVLLARCFANVEHGFYIDVGAQDEEACSVTRYFYEKGWSGINVEPVREFADSFSSRERDITICCAAGSEDAIIPMTVSLNTGLSSFQAENAKLITNLGYTIETRDIQVRKLSSILEDLGINSKSFEFLKVDVEGYELNVIQGIDLLRYRPKIILCEVTKPNTSSKTENYPFLCSAIESHGYHNLYFDGLNQWWCILELRDEFEDYFILPPNILDSSHLAPYVSTVSRKRILGLKKKLEECNLRLEECNLKLDAIYKSKSWKLMRILQKLRLDKKI